MEMTRKKQYENQVTDLALDHTPVILFNPIIILQYLITVTNTVQQIHSYRMLCSSGQGGLSTLADEERKMLQVIQVALEPLQEMRPMWSKPLC